MSKRPENFCRKNLAFDESNPAEKEIYDFLTNSCGRKATSLIVIALQDLLERYDLKDKSKEYVQVFISHYDIFKDRDKLKPYVVGYQPTAISTNVEMPTTKDEKEGDNDAELALNLRNIGNIFKTA